MLTRPCDVRGFTLIELGITVTVLGLLITLALPTFTAWINNTKIRTGTEAMLNGLQIARAEAVRRNVTVQFVLGTQTSWTVSTVGTAEVIQTRSSDEGSGNAVVAITPAGATTLTFNGLGRIVGNGDGTASITQLDVCSGADMPAADMRKLRVAVGSAGNARMCDPQVAAGDPRACPVVAASAC